MAGQDYCARETGQQGAGRSIMEARLVAFLD